MINPKFLNSAGKAEIIEYLQLKDNKIDINSIKTFILDYYSISTGTIVSSCGILALTGIDDIWFFVDEYINSVHKKYVLKQILKYFKKDYSFLIISTTTLDQRQNRMLNEICLTQSKIKKNINTGSKIKIWIYND